MDLSLKHVVLSTPFYRVSKAMKEHGSGRMVFDRGDAIGKDALGCDV